MPNSRNTAIRCPFYADTDDLLSIVSSIVATSRYKIVRTSADMRDRGIDFDKVNASDVNYIAESNRSGLLILANNDTPEPRFVELRDGSSRIVIYDQFVNPNSCRLKLGTSKNGNLLLQSILDTPAETQVSRDMFSDLRKMIIRLSTRVADALILPGAYSKLTNHWRLAPGESYDSKYDVRLGG